MATDSKPFDVDLVNGPVERAKLLIAKIGGGPGLNIEGIVTDLAALERPAIVVHGANALRDEMANAMGVERRTITSLKGYTSVFSDEKMLDMMMAAYAGVRNKRIVELCQRHGVNAIGFSGLDGRVVQGRRNPGIRTIQDGKKVLLRDFSGKPQSVNVGLLRLLVSRGYTPVLTAPIVDQEGAAINMENDDVVTVLARDLDADCIISFIEAPGLLRNPNDEQSIVSSVDMDEIEAVESAVDGRMRRKIKAIRTLLETGRADVKVILADGRTEHPLRDALSGTGTTFRSSHTPLPSGSETSARDLQGRYELDVFGKRGITLISAAGATVCDYEGATYIDCIAGHGAVNLGHGHPRVVEAIHAQLSILGACPGAFYNRAKADYLAALVAAAPENLTRAFLCNSGTEAVEAAMKFARLHTKRPGIVAMQRGFHGRTFGAMSASGDPKLSAPFHPLVPEITHVRFNDIRQLEEAVDENTGAVLVELVQGEGGVYPIDPEYIAAARRICDAQGALLIVDEVQTGFGRTGDLFACQGYAVRPDLLCLAKAIANGAFPMGAVVADDAVTVPVGMHGSTFGGHPVACAAAHATLEALLDGELLAGVPRKGHALTDMIQSASPSLVREIRHVGLMIGLELRVRVRPILEQLAERGVLALPAGTKVLRLLPPLTVSDAQVAEVGEAVVSVCSVVA